MAMNYKGLFHYGMVEAEAEVVRFDVPVQVFEVDGGADRTVKLSSADDISISSELEQARTFKNLTLLLPPTKDGTDMEVALQLSSFYMLKTPFMATFVVERFSNGKMIEGLALIEENATLKNSPYVAGKQLLTVQLKLPAAKLYRGRIVGHSMKSPTAL